MRPSRRLPCGRSAGSPEPVGRLFMDLTITFSEWGGYLPILPPPGDRVEG